MGKTTLYHPVSLYSLRASLNACGFRLGTLRQLKSDFGKATASYWAEITALPAEFRKTSTDQIQTGLASCFSSDVTVDVVTSTYNRKTRKTKLMARISTTVYQDTPLEAAIEAKHNEALSTL